MTKFTYKTITDKKGNAVRYKCWKEEFKDEDNGKSIFIERKRPIKVNGESIVFYPNSQLKKMTKAERDSIKIKWK